MHSLKVIFGKKSGDSSSRTRNSSPHFCTSGLSWRLNVVAKEECFIHLLVVRARLAGTTNEIEVLASWVLLFGKLVK